MNANPSPDSPAAFALPGESVLEFRGPDAVRFAQAQLMSDLDALLDGTWQWTGWLTPKGRVVALGALLRRDAETLWMVLPDMPAARLASELQRYVFRSKVKLIARDDLHVGGAFAAPEQAQGATAAVGDDSVDLDLSGEAGARTLRIGTTGFPMDSDAADRWRACDLEQGLPRLDPASEPQWTPQQLSLERLRAFSVKKGCYPGQEIVARTHFLGQAKRGLALLEAADGSTVMGGTIRDAEGHAVSPVVSASGSWALGVMAPETAELVLDGHPLVRRELQGGLAR